MIAFVATSIFTLVQLARQAAVAIGSCAPYARCHSIQVHQHSFLNFLATVDIVLSDPAVDFTGGEFHTLESDGTQKQS
jgi:hypothetical protein